MGVKGRLADISLVDIIQIFLSEKRSAALHLGSDMGFGHVYIKDGVIVHASYRDSTGADALRQLMSWKDGEFEVESDASPPAETMGEEEATIVIGGVGGMEDVPGLTPGLTGETAGHEDDSQSLIKMLLKLGVLEKI
ncbi:MAG: hypothetical protein BMS9Abin23_1065 [Thermodesulfobacteriota bacterium]|nr:MAG: hypothetical protein BMS9Abin23_1065 [Thermodesulfobacteriota bacterium]